MSEDKEPKYKNIIQCKHCYDVIESIHRHDFKFCKCGKVAVDGGNDYHKRTGYPEDWIEIYEERAGK